MRSFYLFAAMAVAAAGLPAADRTLNSDGVAGAVYFSADGKTVSSSCRDNHVRTWDVTSGKLVKDKAVPAGTFLLAPDLYAEHDFKKLVEIFRPRSGDDGRAHRVFQNEVPANDPGE